MIGSVTSSMLRRDLGSFATRVCSKLAEVLRNSNFAEVSSETEPYIVKAGGVAGRQYAEGQQQS
jgi:hypothetical protein